MPIRHGAAGGNSYVSGLSALSQENDFLSRVSAEKIFFFSSFCLFWCFLCFWGGVFVLFGGVFCFSRVAQFFLIIFFCVCVLLELFFVLSQAKPGISALTRGLGRPEPEPKALGLAPFFTFFLSPPQAGIHYQRVDHFGLGYRKQ